MDKSKEIIVNICTLKNAQKKLVLLLQCIPGPQHLLEAVQIHLSRDFAKQRDEAISTAVAATLKLGDLNNRDNLLLQRMISNHGLGLRNMEKNSSLLLASCGRSSQSNKRFHT